MCLRRALPTRRRPCAGERRHAMSVVRVCCSDILPPDSEVARFDVLRQAAECRCAERACVLKAASAAAARPKPSWRGWKRAELTARAQVAMAVGAEYRDMAACPACCLPSCSKRVSSARRGPQCSSRTAGFAVPLRQGRGWRDGIGSVGRWRLFERGSFSHARTSFERGASRHPRDSAAWPRAQLGLPRAANGPL